jgi:hypothetical protein
MRGRELLHFILDICDLHEKQNGIGKHLPLVIPIVIYHCNGPCKFDNSMITEGRMARKGEGIKESNRR